MDATLARDLAAAYTAYADRTKPRTLFGWSGADVPGLDNQIIGTWMARDHWDRLAAGHWLYANDDFTSYVAAHPDRAADIGVPLIPHDSGLPLNGLLDDVLAGYHDDVYVSMGRSLATLGPATVYARLWWEMNMRPNPADLIDRAKFRASWARAVPLIRVGFASAARPGQTLKVVFCPLSDGADWADFWPGDEHVDVVALDLYAAAWGTTIPTAATLLSMVRGHLDRLAAFARVHAKPLALGEWANWQSAGTGTTNRGRGDFPEYIDAIFDWAQVNPVAYLCYFNLAEGGVGQTLADTPQTLTRLKARAALL